MNHCPAVDVLLSVGRVFNQATDERHRKVAFKLKTILSKYQDVELLVRIAEYKRGADKVTDEAIDKTKAINNFLRQGLHDRDDFKTTIDNIAQVVRFSWVQNIFGQIIYGGPRSSPRYLTESVNYHKETIIIWKNIND
jgi:flagellar biosynthesis/type III secretory pathway ATPase